MNIFLPKISQNSNENNKEAIMIEVTVNRNLGSISSIDDDGMTYEDPIDVIAKILAESFKADWGLSDGESTS